MTLKSIPIEIDDIIDIARAAGDVALTFYNASYAIEQKRDKSPVTAADMAVHRLVTDKLSRYSFPVLSEEGGDTSVASESEYIWIIDPIDGTKDFIQKTGDFSIMIGLIDSSRCAVAGVVYAPAMDVLYYAIRDTGAFLQRGSVKERIFVSKKPLKGGRILTSRNHLGTWEQDIARLYSMRPIPMGSAGLKMCKIAAGEAELYINSSDKSGIWDICAGDVIVREAGGNICDKKGRRIFYNCANTKLRNGYIVTNGDMTLCSRE